MSLITEKEYVETLRDWLGDRVKFEAGWRNRTSAGPFDAHGFTHHWDAIKKRYRLGTHLRVLRAGTSSLPGPLCHLSPARNGDLWVIAGPHANANHAGSGDSRVYREILAGRFDGSPNPTREDFNGNNVFYGFEHMYHPDDGPMPDEQFECGVLATAALAEAHGWTPEGAAGSCLDHYEWTPEKWDRQTDDLAHRTRVGVRKALELGPSEVEVISERDVQRIAKAVHHRPINVIGEKRNKALSTVVTETHYHARRAVDEATEDQTVYTDEIREHLKELVSRPEGLSSDDIDAIFAQHAVKGTVVVDLEDSPPEE